MDRTDRLSVRRLQDEVDRALTMRELAPPNLDPAITGPQTGAWSMAAGSGAPFWISAPLAVSLSGDRVA
ncbi:MAG: hypothetical protein GWN07_14755 [Actinobacteria bacterium]|nr:hypothetical protein [Actinomycetota bacterium]NIU66736.1 hypothetical protein [Actinomycetota bacterium]NIW28536.1 hypothetical protein [Actinomycetota bacterium]NIX21021.1 hypothetical protein [Actinomycetota bacterium]